MINTTQIHLSNGGWNYELINGWVGGHFVVSNLSNGYHGILKQWLDHYSTTSKNCLLVSENKLVKNQFQLEYSSLEFKTLEYYEEMNQDTDLKYNLCEQWDTNNIEQFDIVMCQATFEHLYDPCMAMRNLRDIMKPGGTLLIHTHVPGMAYHPYPKDYLRFYSDWFFDAEQFSNGLKLIELAEIDVHIFSAYQKDLA